MSTSDIAEVTTSAPPATDASFGLTYLFCSAQATQFKIPLHIFPQQKISEELLTPALSILIILF